jgi:hypothetical protein
MEQRMQCRILLSPIHCKAMAEINCRVQGLSVWKRRNPRRKLQTVKGAIIQTVLWAAVSLGQTALPSHVSPMKPASYSHGTKTSCFFGIDGPGIRLSLRQQDRCDRPPSDFAYPYLEIYIKEQPIPVHKSIRIGPINLAFICANPKESCKRFVSGKVIFNHFEETSGKTFPLTDGDYELKFGFGKPETGHFKVECEAPCS